MNRVLRFYKTLLAQPPLWYIRTRRGRAEFSSLHDFFDDTARQVAEDLRSHGHAITTFSKLFPDFSFSALTDYARSLRERYDADALFRAALQSGRETAQKGAKKDFLIPLYGGAWTTPVLEAGNPFTPIMLHPRVLAIAALYLGVFPRLSVFNLSTTRVAGSEEAGRLYSQRWHRDPEDRRILKFFIYLSDVLDDGAGPFTYVQGSHHGGSYARLYPQRPPAGNYPPEGAVEKAVRPGDLVSCWGKAGTIIFADTAGLHRGGFSTTVERTMFTAGFVSDGVLHRPKYSVSDDVRTLSSLARRAVCS